MKKAILAIAIALSLSGCAHVKSTLRTIRDVAHMLCCLTESNRPDFPGDTIVEEYCNNPTVIDHYIQAAKRAGASASAASRHD